MCVCVCLVLVCVVWVWVWVELLCCVVLCWVCCVVGSLTMLTLTAKEKETIEGVAWAEHIERKRDVRCQQKQQEEEVESMNDTAERRS